MTAIHNEPHALPKGDPALTRAKPVKRPTSASEGRKTPWQRVRTPFGAYVAVAALIVSAITTVSFVTYQPGNANWDPMFNVEEF